jgi:hypothetical protein
MDAGIVAQVAQDAIRVGVTVGTGLLALVVLLRWWARS